MTDDTLDDSYREALWIKVCGVCGEEFDSQDELDAHWAAPGATHMEAVSEWTRPTTTTILHLPPDA